jgi:hypothetical protein
MTWRHVVSPDPTSSHLQTTRQTPHKKPHRRPWQCVADLTIFHSPTPRSSDYISLENPLDDSFWLGREGSSDKMKTLQLYYECWVEVTKQTRYHDKSGSPMRHTIEPSRPRYQLYSRLDSKEVRWTERFWLTLLLASFRALQEMGWDPSEAMIILRFEDYNESADREYQRVLKFLICRWNKRAYLQLPLSTSTAWRLRIETRRENDGTLEQILSTLQ